MRSLAVTSLRRTALLALLAVACGPRTTVVPPLGEVMVIVDTDMPVPRLVNRLRIDLYTGDGAWYASRDVSRAKASSWPTSFGIHVPDASHDAHVLVRLRAYPEGEVRDYRGERFAARPTGGPPFDVPAAPAATNAPRLVLEDGADATPSTEPAPLLTVDRLLRVHVNPSVRAGVRVVLRGACIGTMADLVHAKTCVDAENARVAATEEPTTTDTSLPTTSLAGQFGAPVACTAPPRPMGHAADGAPLHDDEACADGATFILGNDMGSGVGELNDLPKRVATLPPFRIDRYEVTVARWRDALAGGFVPINDFPVANEGAIPSGTTEDDPSVCTWSRRPRDREAYPLNCIDWDGARAFCRWAGGDLPTEAQWEYAALVAGRTDPTPFPWGGSPGVAPTCDRAIFGRGPYAYDDECSQAGAHFGPAPVDATGGPSGDVSLGLGVVGLAGSMMEWMRDAFASFSSNCWAAQPLLSPTCAVATPPTRAVRGASWFQPVTNVAPAIRAYAIQDVAATMLGFRCVRPGS